MCIVRLQQRLLCSLFYLPSDHLTLLKTLRPTIAGEILSVCHINALVKCLSYPIRSVEYTSGTEPHPLIELKYCASCGDRDQVKKYLKTSQTENRIFFTTVEDFVFAKLKSLHDRCTIKTLQQFLKTFESILFCVLTPTVS